MAGVSSETVKSALGRKLAEALPQSPAPGVGANPEFIEDDLGDGHPRSVREASRFTAFAAQLVKKSAPVEPPQAQVKVPRLVLKEGRWDVVLYKISGAVTLTVSRPSKFGGKADVSQPSLTLAEFMQGKGRAWADFRDDDMPALLLAWAESVDPSPHDARWASQALAVAMAARAGLAVHSLDHAFVGGEA